MADITVVRTSLTGAKPTMASASENGDLCLNTKRILLHVVNGSGASKTVTVTAQRALCGDPSVHNSVTVIPAGEARDIGPFDRWKFNDSAGKIAITYSAHADVTIGALEVVDL